MGGNKANIYYKIYNSYSLPFSLSLPSFLSIYPKKGNNIVEDEKK